MNTTMKTKTATKTTTMNTNKAAEITFGLFDIDQEYTYPNPTSLPIGKTIRFTAPYTVRQYGELEDGRTVTTEASASWSSGGYRFVGTFEDSYGEWENEDSSGFKDHGFRVDVLVYRESDGKAMGQLNGLAFREAA